MLRPSAWDEVTVVADRLGYESVWMPEHLVIPVQSAGAPSPNRTTRPIPPNVPVFDVFSTSGSWPARTERIHLGTQVYNIGLRHPFAWPGSVTTLDVSRGAGSSSASGPAGSRRMGRGRTRLRQPRPPGRRDHRGLPAPVERGGHRAPRRVLRFRPGHVRAQARPAPVAQPAHRRRRAGRPAPGRLVGDGWIPMNHSLEADPGGPPNGPAPRPRPVGPAWWRSPSGRAAGAGRPAGLCRRRGGPGPGQAVPEHQGRPRGDPPVRRGGPPRDPGVPGGRSVVSTRWTGPTGDAGARARR